MRPQGVQLLLWVFFFFLWEVPGFRGRGCGVHWLRLQVDKGTRERT